MVTMQTKITPRRILGPIAAHVIVPDLGRESFVISGHNVRLDGNRMLCFKERGLYCFMCRLKGTQFYLESFGEDDVAALNLYALTRNREVLMVDYRFGMNISDTACLNCSEQSIVDSITFCKDRR